MRRSKTLEKWRAGKTARICALGHVFPAFIAHAAHHGFDCIWFDCEHRVIEDREIQTMLAYFHLYDIDCMLRTPTREKTKLYRFLEDGATGLLVPLVSTADEARDLVQSLKFPPLGERGLDGAGLDANFALPSTEEFTAAANRETFLVVQIETPLAVKNVDEIASVKGIDGLFIGPADLGLRLKHAGPDAPTLEAATQQVADAAARHGKQWGQPTFSLEHMQKLHAQGARLLTHGSDFGAMMQMLEQSERIFNTAIAAE